MPINFGNQKIKDIYFGNQKIKEVYFGSELVFSSGPTAADIMFASTDGIYSIKENGSLNWHFPISMSLIADATVDRNGNYLVVNQNERVIGISKTGNLLFNSKVADVRIRGIRALPSSNEFYLNEFGSGSSPRGARTRVINSVNGSQVRASSVGGDPLGPNGSSGMSVFPSANLAVSHSFSFTTGRLRIVNPNISVVSSITGFSYNFSKSDGNSGIWANDQTSTSLSSQRLGFYNTELVRIWRTGSSGIRYSRVRASTDSNNCLYFVERDARNILRKISNTSATRIWNINFGEPINHMTELPGNRILVTFDEVNSGNHYAIVDEDGQIVREKTRLNFLGSLSIVYPVTELGARETFPNKF